MKPCVEIYKESIIYFNLMKLYATLETSRGKTVSISDNEQITATVYDGNMKAYSVIIDWCDVGDGQMGAMVTTREWRNRLPTYDKQHECLGKYCNHYLHKQKIQD